MDLRPVLLSSPLFAPAADEKWSCFEESFPAGDWVTDRCRGVPCVGIITRGLLSVSSVTPDGRSTLLNALGPSECFGISNLLEEDILITRLRCLEDSTIVFIPKAEINESMNRLPAFSAAYARICNAKLRFLLNRISLLTMQSARNRLAAWLLLNRKEDLVSLPGTREDLACALNISRAALFRELRVLQEHQVIAPEKSGFRLLRPDALEKLLYQND